jgi:CRISPR-associated protein Cas2
MELLVAYDVATDTAAGRRRLRHVAQVCLAYGQRVQKSVFECSISDVQLEHFQARLIRSINTDEDNLRIYRLLEPKERYVRSFGTFVPVDYHGPLIL